MGGRMEEEGPVKSVKPRAREVASLPLHAVTNEHDESPYLLDVLAQVTNARCSVMIVIM